MTQPIIAPEDQMMQWITSKWITKPISVVTELGIADHLRDGPMSVDALAEKTNTHAKTLYRVLRALASFGIFMETNEFEFGLTPLARCLLSEAMGPLAKMFLSRWHDKAWTGLNHTIRTGKPGFDHVYGKPAFEWLEENPEERAIMDAGQGLKAAGFAKALNKVYNFDGFDSICDLGGGNGTFLIKLLSDYPNIKGSVADLPKASELAEKAIEKANLHHRCKAISYDFLKEAPPLCDAYFLVNILHDWDDEFCLRILANITPSMVKKSRLWVVEYLLEPGEEFCVANLLDLEVLVMGGGRERSLDEYEALFNSAGLKLSQVMPTNNGPALMECRLA